MDEEQDKQPENVPVERDAAKLSDEEAAEAARAFLGTFEPEPEMGGEEAKQVLRRAGVAEAERPVEVAEPEPVEEPAAPVVVVEAAPAAPVADTGRRWYVIHTYSGYENKVKANLEHRIQSMDMGDKIFQVLVPTEEEIEIKNGSARPSSARSFRATSWSR